MTFRSYTFLDLRPHLKDHGMSRNGYWEIWAPRGHLFSKELDGNIHIDIGSFIKKKINIEL